MDDTTRPPQAPIAAYTVTLRLKDGDPETAQVLKERLLAVLGGAGFDPDDLEIHEVREYVESTALLDTDFAPLSALYLGLPPTFQTATVLDALSTLYHRELDRLLRSAQDPRCCQPALRLYPWRRANTQWICEFMSWDRSVAVRGAMNFHGQETSQWSNPLTGWHGHQGAIVFDEVNGQVSAHH